MANALHSRLRRMERTANAVRHDERCPECGHAPGAALMKLKMTFADDRDDNPEHCPRCGTTLIYRLEFDRLG